MKGLLQVAALLALLAQARGQGIPDDHGNSIAEATVLTGGSNTLSAVIEHDLDVDVFSFSFLPHRSYILSIQTGTVWDIQLELIPPNVAAPVLQTNTAWQSAALVQGLTNRAAAARWYLSLSGLLQFTTGTYQLVVAEAPGQDSDNDGMADSWEILHFSNLTADASSDYNADGFSDVNAYLAGLSPTQAVAVQSLARAQSNDAISWVTAPYATYDVSAATNVNGPWSFLHRHTADETGGLLVWTNATEVFQQRYYRLEFCY